MDEIVAKDFPLLAACFIGVVVEHQGGRMSRERPEVIGGYEVKLTAAGRRDKLIHKLPARFAAYSGHKESCVDLPKNSVTLASTRLCKNQMLRIKKNIYACQFHPEFDMEGLALRVQIYKNYGYFPPEAADELIAEAAKHDVAEPVKILRNFVEHYRTAV
jgi:GMP synthase (glutamine-hydrolysing)